MGAKEIQDRALYYFAEYGYERTSLAVIAEDIGIKKQSIYSHYKSKEDLFHQVLDKVIEEENKFVTDFFSQSNELFMLLKEFILAIKTSFLSSKYVGEKFILRNTFLPPMGFKDDVLRKTIVYFNHLEETVSGAFLKEGYPETESRQNAQAFITILDGLLTGLIYGSEQRFDTKLVATWRLFECIKKDKVLK